MSKSFQELSEKRRREFLNSLIRDDDVRNETTHDHANLPSINEIQVHDRRDDQTLEIIEPYLEEARIIERVPEFIEFNEHVESESETEDCLSDIVYNEDEENLYDSDEEDNDEGTTDYEEPLYENAPLTVSQSMLIIATLFQAHNITQTCLEDILNVINLHCINNEYFHKNSLYKFKKYFRWGNSNSSHQTRHYYCSLCNKSLQSARDICNDCYMSKTSYFITMDLSEQLQELYNRPGFYEKLQRGQPEGELNTISDLHDGFIYKAFIANGFLRSSDNISLFWYTDGVPVFKSSQISMWPIYITINELPFKERTKRENLLLAGLWFGNKKPEANMFFQKLRPQFEDFSTGINFNTANGNIIFVKAVLLFGTCDLPAKAHFLNFIYFTGFFGCPSCLIPGETFYNPSGGRSHIYRYVQNPNMRSSDQSKLNAREAYRTNTPINGIKGPCAVAYIMPDFINGTAIDKMHCIDSGVVKKLLTLWFETDYRNCPFSLLPVIQVLNERLTSIKPPKFVHRLPRKVEELVHWKASELKMWFFYYSPVVLDGIMQAEYFQHYLLLIIGIAYLNADNVTDTMINHARNFLHKFVRDFEVLYGLQYCSINIHLILHLPNYVKSIGPLWASSCYQFENLNGQFLKVIHGTGHIDSQIANAHGQLLKMQKNIDQLAEGPLRNFCLDHRHGVNICERLFNGCYSVGRYRRFNRVPAVVTQAIQILPPVRKMKKYVRLLKDKKLYIAEEYRRNLQTSSSNILYMNAQGQPQFGSIYCFIKVNNCVCLDECQCPSDHYAVVQTFTYNCVFNVQGDNEINATVPYLYEQRKTNNYTAIPIICISSVCVAMNIADRFFLAVPVNTKEDE